MSLALIDTNVYLSRWPFRRLPYDDTAGLVAKLRRHGVVQAWVSSFDGLLHKDQGAVNARLAAECRTAGPRGRSLLVPFAALNPTLTDWKEQLRVCHEIHRMPGVRLTPGYHGYKLDDPRFLELGELAAKAGLIVQVAFRIEDERTQHPLLRAPYVDPAPLHAFVARFPRLRLVLLDAFPSVTNDQIARLTALGQVHVDIATLEGAAGVAQLLDKVPLDRVVLGSLAPFFILESALLKLEESALSDVQCRAICELNAQRLRSTPASTGGPGC